MPKKGEKSTMAALQQDVILAVAPLCTQCGMEIAENAVRQVCYHSSKCAVSPLFLEVSNSTYGSHHEKHIRRTI